MQIVHHLNVQQVADYGRNLQEKRNKKISKEHFCYCTQTEMTWIDERIMDFLRKKDADLLQELNNWWSVAESESSDLRILIRREPVRTVSFL